MYVVHSVIFQVCIEDHDRTFPHASQNPSESKLERRELKKGRKLKSRGRELLESSDDILGGGAPQQLNAIESRCSAVKKMGKDGVCVLCVCVLCMCG